MWAASRLREFMPVADLAYRLTGFKKFPPNTHIFASQHLLSTVALMLESFRERSAERIHVLGKCYSTHPDVFSYLRQRGFDVNPRSVHFDSHEVSRSTQKRRGHKTDKGRRMFLENNFVSPCIESFFRLPELLRSCFPHIPSRHFQSKSYSIFFFITN
mmetsp:Transcript_44272/g.73821  ORF Transcript_44272/g.73821 Transcript_44272/m.73821 type:complete len:158 (+) Transcript_44272:189-662(+)